MAHAVAGQPVAVAWLCNVVVVVLVSSHCEASEALPRQLDAMGELAAHVLAAGKRLPLQVARPLVVVARRGEILYDCSASYALIAKRARRRRGKPLQLGEVSARVWARGLLAGSVVCEAPAQACARACVSEP